MLLVVGSYLFGGYGTEMTWRNRVAELEAKVKLQKKKVSKLTQL
jgi:hypothetical protein